MKKPICTTVFLLIFFLSFCPNGSAQQAGKQVPIKVSTGKGQSDALLYLPPDYNKTNKKYPLILFGHGIGERVGLEALARQGLPGIISNNNPPYAMVNGEKIQFIVLSILFPSGWASYTAMSNGARDLIKRGFRIDSSRIYVTGLSAGARATIYYIPRTKSHHLIEVAAAVPMSYTDPTWWVPDDQFQAFQKKGMWCFTGASDVHTEVATTAVNRVNSLFPGHARLTVYPGGHCCWMTYYDPNYRETINDKKMNIYEWMYQYKSGEKSQPPANQPPEANAGSDQSITLPGNSVGLDGSASSDPDGNIASYKWTQKSGPASATIKDGVASKTEVSGLEAGTYVFTLTVTDDKGATATDDISVTVNAAANQPPEANAGRDQSITLPENSVGLDGSASSDPDGNIASYKWTQKSGPASATIKDGVASKTEVSGLEAGTYVFTLTVTDDKGATATDDISVTVNGKTGGIPDENGFYADAGPDITTTMPFNIVTLDASGTRRQEPEINIGVFHWKKVAGPDQYHLPFPDKEITQVKGLTAGTYTFQVTVTITDGKVIDTMQVFVKPDPVDPGDVPYTANTKVPDYEELFQYGSNMGAYGNGWNDTAKAGVLTRNGVHSIRPNLPDYFVGKWGYDIRVDAFDYYTHQLGMKGITLFVGRPRGEYQESHTHVFENLYKSIWDQGQEGTPVNDNNYFALYIYNLVKRYGENVKFWEIVNEPDQTGFWDNGNRKRPDNWWINPPGAGSLINLKAPVFSYIRMLHIAYEVIKKFEPDDYIAPGGIGYPAFLDALLRYSDNPDGGKITSEYPLTGGAYFDVLSFHIYPNYNLSYWDNDVKKVRYRRYSDAAVQAIADVKESFEKVLEKHGYNGKKYPKKPFIITEVNLTRKNFDTYWGGIEAQRNFIIKALVEAQKINIKQLYVYQMGDYADYNTATNPYQLMGLFENMKRDKPGQEKLTTEGTAYKTTSMLLYEWEYDSSRTKQLKLPSTVDGAAFKKGDEYRYVLWAKTHTDLSEKASATYSFPASFNLSRVYQYGWNYSVDPKATSEISSQNIALTGTPAFFTESKVEAANRLPVADAGKNQVITLPLNSITLNASASTDPDGTIVSWKWSKQAGPSDLTIEQANNTITKVSGLVEGTYMFTVTVTDNEGGTATDKISVTVTQPAANQMPEVHAGKDRVITLPANSVILDGSGSSDPDGNITSFKWMQKAGPDGATIQNANAAKTKITGLVEGKYVFNLTIEDNLGETASKDVMVTVNTASNKAPIADAGSNQSITLPKNSITLNGSASKDEDGKIISYNWKQKSGPSEAAFSQAASAETRISGLKEGTYVFVLTTADDKGAEATDEVTVTVNAASNKAPIADAGSNQSITLPENSITLDGSASKDEDGKIASYKWEQKSGPDEADFSQSKNAETKVSGLKKGTYVFTLTVSDDKGSTSSDQVTITINSAAAPNKAPIADAGNNTSVTLPEDSATLDGSASRDEDGEIISYKWEQISGPAEADLSQSNEASTEVSDLQKKGAYVFVLTATDDKGEKAKDEITVTVNASPNKMPIADAGNNATITLPKNSIILDGSASKDEDGEIVSYKWKQNSGPAEADFSQPENVETKASGLKEGTYVFTLTVSDDKKVNAIDSVKVIVKEASIVSPGDGLENNNKTTNQAPVANAGKDKTITLPVDSALLDGSASIDEDGKIVSWKWKQISGPDSAIATGLDNAKIRLSGLKKGQYIFMLAVIDNMGASDSDEVTVKIRIAPNKWPHADAGEDIDLVLPQNSVTLNGKGSFDEDGSISQYHWEQISGPTQAVLSEPASAKCDISKLIMGIYDFRLTVTDDKGAISTATVSIYVNPGKGKEPSDLTFNVYPNPVHDRLHVEFNKGAHGFIKFRVIDVNGRVLKVYDFGRQTIHIHKSLDVSNLTNGIYFIQLIVDNQLRNVYKIVKY